MLLIRCWLRRCVYDLPHPLWLIYHTRLTGKARRWCAGPWFYSHYKDIKWTETSCPTFFGADVIDLVESQA